MGACELDVDVADRRHAQEIRRAREEAGKRRGERDRAARGQPHRRADHHLLGDEVLIEAIGQRLFEPVAEGGVLDVGVERDHPRIRFAQLCDRRAVGFARRDLIALRVCRRRDRFRRRHGARRRRGPGDLRREIRPVRGHELSLELGQRAVELVAFLERPPVPAVLALRERHALPLNRPGENHCRLAFGPARLVERIEDRGEIVTVDHDRVPAERAPAARELLHVVLPHRRAALAEPVDVRDAAQVIQPIHRGDVRGFPDGAFRGLAVAEHHVRPVVRPDPARVQRAPDRGADALAERSCRDVDERQPRRGMPLEIGSNLAQLEQLRSIEQARFRPRRVQNRRRVSLRQDEAIVFGIVRILGIEPHLGEEQRGREVGHRAAARRVAGAGLRRRPQGVDPQARGDVRQSGNQRGAVGGHRELSTQCGMRIEDCGLRLYGRLAHAPNSESRPLSALRIPHSSIRNLIAAPAAPIRTLRRRIRAPADARTNL